MLGKPGKAWENPYMNSTCHQECGYEYCFWFDIMSWYGMEWNGYVTCMGLQLTISGHKNGNVNTNENKCYIIDGYWIILGHGCVANNSGDANESGYHLDIENPRLEDTSGIPDGLVGWWGRATTKCLLKVWLISVSTRPSSWFLGKTLIHILNDLKCISINA
jgi:hypothetical protein